MSEIIKSRRATIGAFMSLALFALNPVFVSYLPAKYNYWGLLFWSLTVATIFLSGFILINFRKDFSQFIKKTSLKGWVGIFLTSLVRTLVSLCFFFAITHTAKIEATVLTLMWPIFFVVFSVLLDSYKPKYFELVTLFLAFTGAAIIVLGDKFPFGFSGVNIGFLMAILAAVLGGFHSVIYKKIYRFIDLSTDISNQVIMIFFRSVIGLALLAFGYLIFGFDSLSIPTSINEISLLIGLGVLSYAGTQVLYCYALLKMDAVELSGIQYFNPIIVTFFISVFVGETITDTFLIGALVVFASQYFLQFKSTFISAERTATFFAIPVLILVYFFNSDDLSLFKTEALLIHDSAPALVGTIFALLVSFSLSRVVEKSKELNQKQIKLYSIASQIKHRANSKLLNADIESYLHAVIDLDWMHTSKQNLELLDNIDNSLNRIRKRVSGLKNPEGFEPLCIRLENETDEWSILRLAKSTTGEVLGIWVLGILALLSLIALNTGGLIKDIFVLTFSFSVIYLCALAIDVERNYNGRNFEVFYFMLNSLKRLGFDPYIPWEIAKDKKLPVIRKNIKFCTVNAHGNRMSKELTPLTRGVNWVQKGLFIAAIITMLTAFILKYEILR